VLPPAQRQRIVDLIDKDMDNRLIPVETESEDDKSLPEVDENQVNTVRRGRRSRNIVSPDYTIQLDMANSVVANGPFVAIVRHTLQKLLCKGRLTVHLRLSQQLLGWSLELFENVFSKWPLVEQGIGEDDLDWPSRPAATLERALAGHGEYYQARRCYLNSPGFMAWCGFEEILPGRAHGAGVTVARSTIKYVVEAIACFKGSSRRALHERVSVQILVTSAYKLPSGDWRAHLDCPGLILENANLALQDMVNSFANDSDDGRV
jgi:hypothetical protein